MPSGMAPTVLLARISLASLFSRVLILPLTTSCRNLDVRSPVSATIPAPHSSPDPPAWYHTRAQAICSRFADSQQKTNSTWHRSCRQRTVKESHHVTRWYADHESGICNRVFLVSAECSRRDKLITSFWRSCYSYQLSHSLHCVNVMRCSFCLGIAVQRNDEPCKTIASRLCMMHHSKAMCVSTHDKGVDTNWREYNLLEKTPSLLDRS